MLSEMSHWERVQAGLRGEEVDHLPLSLWRHWPVTDQDPAALADAMLRWQRTFDFDVVKHMPTGTYAVEDWGVETTYEPSKNGTRTVTRPAITQAEQWPRLRVLDPARGALGREILALRLTAEALAGSVPILQTVFSPLTTARKLAGDRVFADLREYPDHMAAALDVIARTTIGFVKASLSAGAHGIYFASQCSTNDLMTVDEYRQLAAPWDMIVLRAVEGAPLNVVHLHGPEPMIEVAATYPAPILSWHDRRSNCSLTAARARFPGVLMGGVNEQGTLLNGPVAAIGEEIADAVAQAKGRGLILAPGCVCPIATPESHVWAAVRYVRGGGGT